MANILKMEKTILIQQLLQLGWSYRQIERETGIRRETIAKYDPQRSKPAKVRAEVPAVVENCPQRPSSQFDLAHRLSLQFWATPGIISVNDNCFYYFLSKCILQKGLFFCIKLLD